MHNRVRSDRYKETIYKEEKSKLEVDTEKIYQIKSTCKQELKSGRPDDIPSDIPDDIPSASTGKGRLGKGRLGKVSKDNTSNESEDSLPSKKKTKSTVSKLPEEPDDKQLHASIQEAFLSKNGDKFTNYAKEGKAIKQLIVKARARDPDSHQKFIKAMISRFWQLKSSKDKFWSSQPFLPSALNASGIFDRVLETYREEESYELTDEQIEELARQAAI